MSNACQSGHGGGNMTPAVKGKFTGIVLRALTIDVSVVDLTVKIEKATTWKNASTLRRRARARMLVTTRPGLILTRSRISTLPSPKMAAVDRSHTSAPAVHLLQACC